MALAMKKLASSGIAQQLLPAAGALLPGLGATATQLQARRTKMSHSEASACRGCRRAARVAIAAMPYQRRFGRAGGGAAGTRVPSWPCACALSSVPTTPL